LKQKSTELVDLTAENRSLIQNIESLKNMTENKLEKIQGDYEQIFEKFEKSKIQNKELKYELSRANEELKILKI
jgi:peptidoglycan hydrolase CwlO-like protein